MTSELTFEDCVDVIREGVLHNQYGEEYLHALNMITVMWDQEKATAINQAVAPTQVKPVPDGYVYILMDARSPSYLVLSRDQRGTVVKPA